MASEPRGEKAARGVVAARRQIESAEAARVLGLPIPFDLSDGASRWVSDGIDTANSRALAGASADTPEGVRLALLAELAEEIGVSFASTSEARTVHAEDIVRSMSAGEDAGGRLYALANGYTDELVGSIRGFIDRLRRGSRPSN
ncbi:MAG: hypothetical protein JWR36_283 [Glaciihabitans sp.]|nr:hypothetical protein [Glaciihabitans sp.]